MYTTGRDEKYWPDAKSFKPERWVREESNKRIINNHASLPFGLGIRSCVGRRVAEVQMQFLLSRVSTWIWMNTKDVKLTNKSFIASISDYSKILLRTRK